MAEKKKSKKQHNKVLTAIMGVLCVCIVTCVVIFGYLIINVVTKTNGDLIIDLDDYRANQNQTSFIYAYDENGDTVELTRLHAEENRVWADLKDISPYVADAFIGLEDKRFNTHNGVDWIRVLGVVVKPQNIGQGGSTITQQLIKNITGEKDVTFVRKFNEILSALNLEKHYSKDDILEAYLNTVYLGNGCYGVQTAAESYFGKDVSELNLAEAACIACITKAPYGYNPIYNFDANQKRMKTCLSMMLKQGLITQSEYDEAINYKLILSNDENFELSAKVLARSKKANKESDDDNEIWSWYIDFLINELVDDFMDEYGMNKRQALNKIYYGGLKIYAAVDLDIQDKLESVYRNYVTFPDDEAQSAMTIMDYKGRVVAIVGGAGEKTENRSLVRASDSPRPPGSTIKPIATYAPLLDMRKITYSSKFLDSAFAYNGEMWPHNVDKTLGSGSKVTVQKAIQESYNTVPARLINETLTINTSIDYLVNHFMLGHVDDKSDRALGPLAIGSLTYGATTLEMAAAYATFGNGGKYYEPYAYYKVTNATGSETIFDNTDPGYTQAISPEAANIMNKLLQTVPTSYYGSAESVRRFPIFAKTGTTSNEKDRWFCAGTPIYVGAVWYGYDIPKTINASINPAGKLFFEVFDRIHRSITKNSENEDFKYDSNMVSKTYCTVTGNLAGSGCYSTATGWYDPENLPDTCGYCSGHRSSSTKQSSSTDEVSEVISNINEIIDVIIDENTNN